MIQKSRMLAATLLFGILSCESTRIKNSDDPEVIYKAAVQSIEKERFIEADEYLKEIRTRFPQSRFSVLAELRQADLYFAQDLYLEAAASYGTFAQLYPSHADAPYASFQKALSHFKDAPELIARDQGPAADAAKTAEALVKRYPGTDYARKAQELFYQSRLKLAQKEAYVAEFYQKRGSYLAAQRRWLSLKSRFSDLATYPEAKDVLLKADKEAEALAKKL
jgi:outer membrane protein assembly factor BamD